MARALRDDLHSLGVHGSTRGRRINDPASLLDNSNSHLGWDLGGGLMIFAGQHLGVRGDIRHFHTFQNLSLGLPLGRTKLDFGRASAALVVRF